MIFFSETSKLSQLGGRVFRKMRDTSDFRISTLECGINRKS